MLDKSPRPSAVNVPNDLAAHWMPFTANRAFKKNPRLLAGAKDMHYITVDGRQIIDAAAGMWCCNAGHGRTQISSAIGKQAEALDYAPPFQFGIPQAFELASRIADLAPAGLDHVFFCNSGSEAADTALKIALAYHQINGQGTRTRLIGRERGYHGVGFGGTSVGGIVNNRKMFGTLLGGRRPSAAHLRPREAGLQQGRAGIRRAFRRRAGAAGQSAWRLHHRRRHRRADGGIDRRAAGAEGLSQAAARDHPEARHPADFRRGHHRLWPARLCLCRGTLWRTAGHADLRQGRHQWCGADGRRDRARHHPRRLHERPGACRRTDPRLYLFGPSAGLRRRRLPRSTSIATKSCSSVPTSSSRNSRKP